MTGRPLEITKSRGPRLFVFAGIWIALVVAVSIWIHFDQPGVDAKVYTAAIRSLRAAHDPYADGIAVQQAYHQRFGDLVDGEHPHSYVYSPITLLALRPLARVPLWLSGRIYWLVYVLAVFGQIPIAFQFATSSERRVFLYLAPAAAFFPAMILNDVVLSGNIAYILYLAAFWAALDGWRRGRWGLFYAVVLLISCVKAPLLSLAAIPALSARKQWLPAGITAAAGVALFAAQRLIWPTQFANYLYALNLQFRYNHDFGCSPAGLFGAALFRAGREYSPAGFIFYLCYAIPLFACLAYLSRLHLRGRFPLRQWIPVLLVGIVMLNPRIMDYDLAPITLPLALIAWRFFAASGSTAKAIVSLATLFIVVNVVAAHTHNLETAPLLLMAFAAGCWTLTRAPVPKSQSVDELAPISIAPAA